MSKKTGSNTRQNVQGMAAAGIGRAELFSLIVALGLGMVAFDGKLWIDGGICSLAVALLLGLVVVAGQMVYVQLFAGMEFSEVMVYAFGRAGGRIVLFFLAVLWLVLAGCSAVWAVLLWQNLGIGGISKALYLLLFLLVAGLMAAAGKEALGRVALLVILPGLLLVLANLGLTLTGADFANLLPQKESSFLTVAEGLQGGLLMWAGLNMLPTYFFEVRKVKQHRGVFFLAIFSVIIFSLLVGMGIKIVLSEAAALYDFPLVQVFRLAEVGNWFSRFEVIGAGVLAAILLVKVAVVLGGVVHILGYMWKVGAKCSYRLAVGVAVVIWGALLTLAETFGGWQLVLAKVLGCLPYAVAVAFVVLPWGVVLAGWLKNRREHKTVVVRH